MQILTQTDDKKKSAAIKRTYAKHGFEDLETNIQHLLQYSIVAFLNSNNSIVLIP